MTSSVPSSAAAVLALSINCCTSSLTSTLLALILFFSSIVASNDSCFCFCGFFVIGHLFSGCTKHCLFGVWGGLPIASPLLLLFGDTANLAPGTFSCDANMTLQSIHFCSHAQAYFTHLKHALLSAPVATSFIPLTNGFMTESSSTFDESLLQSTSVTLETREYYMPSFVLL